MRPAKRRRPGSRGQRIARTQPARARYLAAGVRGYEAGTRIVLSSAALWATLCASVAAQWIGYPTPGIPRTRDGKPDLAAPAPRTSDGRPDLSGIWLTPSGRWLQNLAADGVEVPFTPASKAIWDERRANNGTAVGRCTHGVTISMRWARQPRLSRRPLPSSCSGLRLPSDHDGRPPPPKDPQPAWPVTRSASGRRHLCLTRSA